MSELCTWLADDYDTDGWLAEFFHELVVGHIIGFDVPARCAVCGLPVPLPNDIARSATCATCTAWAVNWQLERIAGRSSGSGTQV